MIKSLKVTGLNRSLSFDLKFHEDINIVTGRNGSGKTTVLKLLWYAISGHLERIISEIPLDSFELETDKIHIAMSRDAKKDPRVMKFTSRIGASKGLTEGMLIAPGIGWEMVVEQLNRQLAVASGSSVFFPTFRRIEGGFSIATRPDDEIDRPIRAALLAGTGNGLFGGEQDAIQQAMDQLSDRLSVGAHRFVASISTDDINLLLTLKYAELSEKNNRIHMDLSRFILQRVEARASSDSGTDPDEGQTRRSLEEIKDQARHVTRESEALLRPFTILSDLISRIFQHRGIKLAGPVTLGEAREAISSDLLSAGEKQLLSFLCYNAFANQSCIFIDEPEISLHVDWQRLLFPILLKQSTGNQFIVATHSPFIYSKYADKELVLAEDRGDEDADAPDDREGDRRLPRENQLADIIG